MEENYETILTGYPTVINLDCTKEIINQMEKNIAINKKFPYTL